MGVGVVSNERARQTAYTVKRLNFFKGFLATLCKGLWGNQPIFEVFG
jgi:hypothetical protein